MLIDFFSTLRQVKIPVTIRELLDVFAALESNLAFASMDEFYLLARTCLVKDEKYYDKFDVAFGTYFNDLQFIGELLEALIPQDWIRKEMEKVFTAEEMAEIEAMGGLDALMEAFKKRLEEQKERHEGGNKWIGTGGTSPFGNGGYNPMGVRVGGEGGQKKAAKVWDKRSYKNLDDSVELGTRNIKVALRRLRKFARTGAADELDLNGTISSTARNGGLLDIKMIPERHNSVKVLLFLDVGGSMDPYVKICEELFSAARTEFKHLEYFYFHNFIYDAVWKDNYRRTSESIRLHDIMHKYSSDYKVVFVGDASMSPYEIGSPGGCIEFFNEEAGEIWMRRLKETYEKLVWLNPTPNDYWGHTQTVQMTRQLVEDKMYPLTLQGLEDAMAFLSK